MNHTYRLIWSQDRQRYAPAPETACSHGKASGCKTLACAAVMLVGATLAPPSFAQAPPAANALPTGGKVVSGQASIGQTGSQMHIEQGSDKAILNWSRFDIGKSASVQFQQPGNGSVALNRVLAGEASQIQGKLSANGQVWLLNPHGIVFGQGSKVDVGGLVASTLGITDKDFLDGKAVFTRDGATGGIVNQGAIQAAEGGLIALLAPTVRNDGIITAQLGTVAMAAGDKVTLQAGANGLLQVQVDPATMRTLVENRQLIMADGGQVVMTGKAADALSSSVVANTGNIQANTLQEKDGRILLIADMRHGETKAAGTLQAKFVDTSAAMISIDPNLQVNTHGGEWLIDPVDITIDSAKATTIQNALGSGNVTVSTAGAGGDPGDIHINADISYVKNKLTLNADHNINLNAVLAVNGNGTLAMNYGGTKGKTGQAPAQGSNLNALFKAGGGFAGRVDFAKQGKGLLSINGHAYTVIKDAIALQNINTTILAGRYAVGGDIDASSISNFTPINRLIGVFDGLGHTINHLNLISNSFMGHASLFESIGNFEDSSNSSLLRNIGIENAFIKGNTYASGLAGNNYGSITNAYVVGKIIGSSGGGLVQANLGTIANAYASVEVMGDSFYVGGLVGFNQGTITNAYATGNVTGSGYYSGNIGGLVGHNSGTITNAYATGNVIGYNRSGGLVGVNEGIITNAYAAGSVTGTRSIGGLVGYNGNGAAIVNAYAIGAVTGQNNVGGLAGANDGGTLLHTFYATTDARGKAINTHSDTSGTGKTLAALKRAATYASWGSAIDDKGGTSATWRIYDGYTTPLLRSLLKPVIVAAGTLPGKTYDGTAASGSIGSYAPSVPGATLDGSLRYATQGKNAGTYSTEDGSLQLSGLYSTQQGYDIRYAGGTTSLSIDKATLTLKAVTDTRIYDGGTASSKKVTVTGLANGDKVTGLKQAFDSKNAGKRKLQVSNGYTVADGNGGGNYKVKTVDANGTISKATLTLSAVADTRTYDGGTASSKKVTVTGLAKGDKVTNLKQSFDSKNAGKRKLQINSGYTVADGNGGKNYTVKTAKASGTINKATLTLSAVSDTKAYDGTTASDKVVKIKGLAAGDAVENLSQSFDSKKAGKRKLTVNSGYTVADDNSGKNYTVKTVSATGHIQ